MKNTWRHLFRRLAAACVICGGFAWSSASSYAVQLAYDTADDPAYADGWQESDNGGFGFTPWNFDAGYWWEGTLYSYAQPGFHEIDNGTRAGTQFSNPFNAIGRAWTVGTTPDSDGAPRYGRGFPALQPGQTISVVVDNPTDRKYYNGYFVRFNGGTDGMDGNLCGGGDHEPHSCTPGATAPENKLTWWRFEDFNNGVWKLGDNAGDITTSLFDTNTAEAGMRLDLTLTGADAYELTVTPLANPASAYVHTGTLRAPGVPLDWFEITFFNTPSDTTTPPEFSTDFYIRSIEITGAAPPGVPGDYNDNGAVDAADYVIWRKLMGQSVQLKNEVAGTTPGSVTVEDYAAWRTNFGNPAGGASVQSIAGAAVPEPGGLVGLFGAIAGWLGLGRSRKNRALDQ
jgi:hypothetical protein